MTHATKLIVEPLHEPGDGTTAKTDRLISDDALVFKIALPARVRLDVENAAATGAKRFRLHFIWRIEDSRERFTKAALGTKGLSAGTVEYQAKIGFPV